MSRELVTAQTDDALQPLAFVRNIRGIRLTDLPRFPSSKNIIMTCRACSSGFEVDVPFNRADTVLNASTAAGEPMHLVPTVIKFKNFVYIANVLTTGY